MKKHISIIASALAVLSLASCSKDTEGMTQITYYAVIDLEGPVYDQAVAGTPYQDPGYSATMQGEDITADVKVSTDMDLQNPKPGYYTVTYSAVNEDGFPASSTRYVLVTDPDDKASGYYTTDANSFRVASGGTTYYGNSYSVTVYGDGSGHYHVSDFLGGWYAQRAGYGGSYAAVGQCDIAADGTISLVSSSVAGWGDSLVALNEGRFDAATGTISWVALYPEDPVMEFHVIMTK